MPVEVIWEMEMPCSPATSVTFVNGELAVGSLFSQSAELIANPEVVVEVQSAVTVNCKVVLVPNPGTVVRVSPTQLIVGVPTEEARFTTNIS